MQLQALNNRQVVEVDVSLTGKTVSTCPICSHKRKKKTIKCFTFTPKATENGDGLGYCNHCEERFVEYKPHKGTKSFIIPVISDFKELPKTWIDNILEKRMISSLTLNKLKIAQKTAFFHNTGKVEECIAFPFYRGDVLVYCKYRGSNKKFTAESGAELIWYNYNALIEESAREGTIIITEGEWDAASFIQDGYSNVISVPNGANVGDMYFLENSMTLLDKIKKFYIAVDNDSAGILLKDELVRRLGADRCHIVTFEEHKDANAYLLANGYGSLQRRLDSARQPRIDGIFLCEDMLSEIQSLFEFGLQRGKLLDFEPLDKYISWETGMLCVISATPSSGKSEMTDFICTRLNTLHGWKVAYYSPETSPTHLHYSKIFNKIVGSEFVKTDSRSSLEFWNGYEYIKENFFWVEPNSVESVEDLLNKFFYYVKVKGVKIVVLDPFNKVASGVEFSQQGIIIDMCSKFCRKHNILFFLIAHPKKLQKNAQGVMNTISPYDIAGTSDFWNMCDYMFLMDRVQSEDNGIYTRDVNGIVSKVKNSHLGQQGIAELSFDMVTKRYFEAGGVTRDKSNWIRPDSKYMPMAVDNHVVKQISLDPKEAISSFESVSMVKDGEIIKINNEDIPF